RYVAGVRPIARQPIVRCEQPRSLAGQAAPAAPVASSQRSRPAALRPRPRTRQEAESPCLGDANTAGCWRKVLETAMTAARKVHESRIRHTSPCTTSKTRRRQAMLRTRWFFATAFVAAAVLVSATPAEAASSEKVAFMAQMDIGGNGTLIQSR